MGIEPTSSAWKAEVLPLNYARTRTMLPNSLFYSQYTTYFLIVNFLLLAFFHLVIIITIGGGGRIRTYEG
nr:hypothetical protein [uncultured gamma proteobacterium HF0770_27E13]